MSIVNVFSLHVLFRTAKIKSCFVTFEKFDLQKTNTFDDRVSEAHEHQWKIRAKNKSG